MTYDEIEKMINKYFDGELEKGTEPLLFTQLSLNEEAREYFKDMNSVKETILSDEKEFPFNLEERIMHSIEEKIANTNRFQFWKNPATLVSYGFVVILLIFSLLFYSKKYEYKQELETTKMQINHQSQMISLLMNSTLPMAKVEFELKDQIVVEGESDDDKNLKQISL